MNLSQRVAVLLVVAVVAQADHHGGGPFGGGGGGGGGPGGGGPGGRGPGGPEEPGEPGGQQGPPDGGDGPESKIIIDYGGLKPGICPVEQGEFGICGGTLCLGDEDCPGNDKCCERSCGKMCMPPDPFPTPEPEPSLQCPHIAPTALGNCDAPECLTDGDCSDTEKCCGSGCGYHCTPAVAAGTPPPPTCDGDLVFVENGPVCEETCTEDRPAFCPDITLPGCSCPAGTIRLDTGSTTCVPPQDCPNVTPEVKQPTCTGDLVFNNCAVRCQQTCSEPEVRPCTKECARGCFCPSGKLRESLDSDRCYSNITECPPPSIVVDTPNTAAPVTCDGDLVYNECGSACELTCEEPEPKPCILLCVPGCFCPTNTLRMSDSSSSCVPQDQCPTPEPVPRPCETERAKKLNLPGAFAPQCTPDGLYAPTQCHSSTGYCWCANITTGAVINNTEVQFTRPQCPPPPELPDPSILNQCPEGKVFAPGIKKCISPPDPSVLNQCPEGRVFAPGVKKCILPPDNENECTGDLEAHSCTSICDPYCNQPEGILCATVCVPGCRCPPGTVKLAQDSDQCVPESQCPAPSDTDGIECTGDMEAHSCTSICDPYCNQPDNILCATVCVPGCRCPPGSVKLAQDSDVCVPESQCPDLTTVAPVAVNVTECEGNLQYTTCGTACPLVCSQPEPLFCTYQCVIGCACPPGMYLLAEGSTTCVVKNDCQELLVCGEGYILNEDQTDCVVEKPCPVRLAEAQEGGILIGEFFPTCEADDSYREFQCLGSTGYCWCVDINTGVKHLGTDVRGRPDCSAFRNIQPFEVTTAVPDQQTDGPNCPDGQVYMECGSACPANCDQAGEDVACIAMCVSGCFCPTGLVLIDSTSNVCIPPEDCPVAPTCEGNLEYNPCGTACPLVCGQPEARFCTSQCVVGCACPLGMYLLAEGSTTCVAKEDCPFSCPAKIGYCPYVDSALLACTEECKDDFDCEGERRCCPHSCGSVCHYPNFPVPQPYPLPGPRPTSPPPEGISVQSCPASDYAASSCDSLCESDGDCALTEMCCDNTGCGGNICVAPVTQQKCTTIACPVFEDSTPYDVKQKMCGSDYNFIVKVRNDGKAKIVDDLKYNINPHISDRPIVSFDMDPNCTVSLQAEKRYSIFVSGKNVKLLGTDKFIILDHTVLIMPMTGHRKNFLVGMKNSCPIA